MTHCNNKIIALSIALSLSAIPALGGHKVDLDQALATNTNVVAQGQLGEISFKDGKLLFTVPFKFIDREFLLSSCISRTTHYKWMAVGSRTRVIHAKIEQEGDRFYLKKLNTSMIGNAADSASIRTIKDSRLDTYLLQLPVVAKGGSSVTLDVTELFSTDRVLSPFSWYFNKANTTFDKDMSRIMGYKVFDDNLSVRSLFTYRYSSNGDSPAGVCSAEMVSSILLLPETKMRPRIADSRVGLFTESKESIDLAQSDFYQSLRYAQRWRIEPADWEAWKRGEKVKPTKPIVYYIDNEFPENWKEPLRKGILLWNEAFELFGLKDVVEVRNYPLDDPDFDEDNLKYSCIRYIATDRGAAQGPSWSDPTTGELLSASVYVWASLPEVMNSFCFSQTAQVNKSIRSGKMTDEELSVAIQCIISHEIGHTLGLAHNMGASAAYPVDSLLNADFVKRNGITASVMDYIYYNYIVPSTATDIPTCVAKLGPYDKLALEFIYRPTEPSLSPKQDLAIAETWLDKHAGDMRYRYGIQQWGNHYDPTSLTDDISDDALRAGDLSIENLKYVVNHLQEWLDGGEKAGQRREMYKAVLKHYKTLLKNALYNVGGIQLSFAKEGTGGKTFKSLPYDRQKQAMEWVARQLHQSSWIDKRELTANFEPSVDVSAEVLAELSEVFSEVSENVVLSSHLATEKPYTLQDFSDDIYNLYFDLSTAKSGISLTDKVLQRSIVKALLDVLGNDSQTDAYVFDDAAPTSFALDGGDGYIRNISVSTISEQKSYILTLLRRIDELAKTNMKKAPKEDQPHWSLMEYGLRKWL